MGLRSQLGWMRNGAERTNATLTAYASELRALQEKVEALTRVTARLDTTLGRSDATHAAEIDAMKDQLRTITDDLGDRIGALSQRLESQLSA